MDRTVTAGLNEDEPAAASEGHWQPEVLVILLSKGQPAVPFQELEEYI